MREGLTMANYSVQMRSYVEMMIRNECDVKRTSHRERIALALDKIFDFDFPIFDENYRKTIETKIIRYFYFAELGNEVVGQFQFNLETWLNQYMPYYNQLYESQLIKYDPLINVDYRDKYTRSNDSNRNTTGEVNHKGDKTTDQQQNSNANQNSSQNSNSNTIDSLSENKNDTTKTNTDGSKTSDTDLTENATHLNSTNGTSNSTTDGTEKINETTHGEHVGAKKVNSQSIPQNRVNAETGYSTQIDVTNDNSEDNGTKETDTTNHSETKGTTFSKEDYSGDHSANTKYQDHTHEDELSKSASNHTATDNTTNATNQTGNASSSEKSTNNVLQNSTDQTNNHENQKFNNTEDYVFHRYGKVPGTDYAKMISELRDNIINVDDTLLRQMDKDLFMQVIL